MSIFNNQAYIYIGGKKDSWDSQIQKAYRGEISGTFQMHFIATVV